MNIYRGKAISLTLKVKLQKNIGIMNRLKFLLSEKNITFTVYHACASVS